MRTFEALRHLAMSVLVCFVLIKSANALSPRVFHKVLDVRIEHGAVIPGPVMEQIAKWIGSQAYFPNGYGCGLDAEEQKLLLALVQSNKRFNFFSDCMFFPGLPKGYGQFFEEMQATDADDTSLYVVCNRITCEVAEKKD